MDLRSFLKIECFPNFEGVSLSKEGSFELWDETLYVRNVAQESVFQSDIKIFNVKQFCKVVKLMGTEVHVEHVVSADDNFIRMVAGRKTVEYTITDPGVIIGNQYVAGSDSHLLDKVASCPVKMSIKLNHADRKEMLDALNLLDKAEEAYFEQNDKGFLFIAGKGSRIKCEVKLSDGDFNGSGFFFVKFNKDYFKALLSACSDDAEFVFNSVNGGPAPLQVNDGNMTYVLVPFMKQV